MAQHFCWFVKLLFLLLMLARAPTTHTRPAGGAPPSELIAGNEFLKLFLARDELQRDLHSGEYQQGGSGGAGDADDADGERSAGHFDKSAANEAHEQAVERGAMATAAANGRSMGARSVGPKSRNEKRHVNGAADDGKQVVKLVTSGSKIVFLEEYDDNDAVVDAVARDIDLQKENVRVAVTKSPAELQKQKQQQLQQQKQQQQTRKANPSDEVKVVAVSVSSSSKRATKPANKLSQMSSHARQADIMRQAHKTPTQANDSSTASTFRAKQSLELTTATAPATTTRGDFVNRSHKSEFSIEEAEPLTMSQRQTARVMNTPFVASPAVDAHDEVDSENSASTNIHNVLAAPLVQSASTRSTSSVAMAYHSGNRNASTSSHINHSPHANTHDTSARDADVPASAPAADTDEDKLLPFQTVIYHDTKEGHGPQSRSISYSSLSQNVDDLHRWRQSGILAEAQRNVSESLKPATAAHTSEPAKFYSVPAKMYGEPAKFYSEPSKVYSEPAKVYGQPEKFYSEPAKVYSQPSKFYSEPAKVYSQPAKVYGEPAKTYWPHAAGATTTSTTTATPPSTTTTKAATPMAKAPAYAPRRPAVVSRIAFGEAHSSTTAPPTNYDNESQAPTSTATHHYQPHRQHGHSHAHSHSHSHSNPSTSAHSQPQSPTQARRVLFNLDKLPYDLLNAPVQSSKHLLDPDFPSSPPAAVTYSSPRQRQCLESAFSASLSQSATQQQQLLQQQRQHSSLSDQHSNQNAKGLPNRDLVKCVSKYAQPAAPAAPHTTESSHIDELYTPTPEQNYEIEESVSVMTNGRVHGVQGIHGPTTAAPAAKAVAAAAGRPAKVPTRMRYGGAGGRLHHYSGGDANANVNGDAYDDGDEGGADGVSDGAVDVDAGDGGGDNGDDGDPAAGNKGDDDDDDAKVAYVVEGRNYRKYRVEEKTDDGFIVGEYGVVDHNDGNLRGVRYTADSTINRSLIQKALLTFLKLK